jgi:hypothetical protein
MRSWPLLVLAAPAAAEVWSGWVGVARMTGFGMVSPLPGIWPSLRLDTSVTLPVGVECYAALALRAWLSRAGSVSGRTRRFARSSAICSLALGMAGQVAYHLLAQAGTARAPWPVTTIVSCLPVLVLAMGTALAHMLREDAGSADATGPAAVPGPCGSSPPDRSGDHPDHAPVSKPAASSGPPRQAVEPSRRGHNAVPQATRPDSRVPKMDQARLTARRLAETGKPLSRRTLRSGGVKGSNESLNKLAREVNAELANATPDPPQATGPDGQVIAARPCALLSMRDTGE